MASRFRVTVNEIGIETWQDLVKALRDCRYAQMQIVMDDGKQSIVTVGKYGEIQVDDVTRFPTPRTRYMA